MSIKLCKNKFDIIRLIIVIVLLLTECILVKGNSELITLLVILSALSIFTIKINTKFLILAEVFLSFIFSLIVVFIYRVISLSL